MKTRRPEYRNSTQYNLDPRHARIQAYANMVDYFYSGDFWSTSSQSPTSEPVQQKETGLPDYALQRKNLALVAKIATRALIDPCLEKSIVLEETYPPLVQFLFVLEYVLLHGLKSKVSMFNKNKSFWAGFHSKYMESLDKSLKDTNRTVQDMPGIKGASHFKEKIGLRIQRKDPYSIRPLFKGPFHIKKASIIGY